MQLIFLLPRHVAESTPFAMTCIPGIYCLNTREWLVDAIGRRISGICYIGILFRPRVQFKFISMTILNGEIHESVFELETGLLEDQLDSHHNLWQKTKLKNNSFFLISRLEQLNRSLLNTMSLIKENIGHRVQLWNWKYTPDDTR